MKIKTLVIALLLSGVTVSAQAARLPASGGYDSRVQQIVYNPNDVTIVKTKAGVVTLIQLEEGEVVKSEDTGLGIGDPEAWNTAVRGSNIFLRPKAEQPDTNIAIVTNRRSYSVMLTTTDKNPTYVLRYIYPKAPEPVKPNVMLGKSQVRYPCTEGNLVNGRYEVKGSQKVKPDALWDNGRMTCMRWNSATDLPVVFRVMPDGKEQLVNYHMDKNVMVIHEVSPGFVLRLGSEVMQVRTAGNVKRAWNANGTATGDVRVEK
ncbi:haloacid dehalogenase [Salmonella enterica subsp. enterica serovar Oranienburg]|nr:haloacid dehalogenase [Salmonella enterica subsp. enterica serovar Oranienburg]